MDVKAILDKYAIKPNLVQDQFFLMDDSVISKAIKFADLNPNDVVLEVGAGTGNLTREIAKKVGRVISFEIDQRLKPLLNDLPNNVELHLKDAWEYIQLHGKWRKKREYNKIVSNLPYSFAEKFLHNLTFLSYDKVILLVPNKFAKKIELHPIFSSFFKVKILCSVDKNKFYPVPRTNSVLIDLLQLPDPLLQKNLPLFLRQYMYQHEDQKVKNSLVEGLIIYHRLTNHQKMTKNEARKIVESANLTPELLDTTPGSKIYPEVTNKFQNY